MSNIVTYQQAESLKYLGFRRDCLHYYNYDGNEKLEEAFFFDGEERVFVHDLYEDFNDSNNTCSAPTVSEALNYIIEEKHIPCYVDAGYCHQYDTVGYWGVVLSDFGYIKRFQTVVSPTHPLASSALLTAVLEYLEKKQS